MDVSRNLKSSLWLIRLAMLFLDGGKQDFWLEIAGLKQYHDLVISGLSNLYFMGNILLQDDLDDMDLVM